MLRRRRNYVQPRVRRRYRSGATPGHPQHRREPTVHNWELRIMAGSSQGGVQVGRRKPVTQGDPAREILAGSPTAGDGRTETSSAEPTQPLGRPPTTVSGRPTAAIQTSLKPPFTHTGASASFAATKLPFATSHLRPGAAGHQALRIAATPAGGYAIRLCPESIRPHTMPAAALPALLSCIARYFFF